MTPFPSETKSYALSTGIHLSDFIIGPITFFSHVFFEAINLYIYILM